MTAPTPPAEDSLDEILLKFSDDSEEFITPALAEAKAKLQALISQEAIKARIDEWEQLPDENKPEYVITYKELRLAELQAALTKGGE